MHDLENLRKQAKRVLRWHRDGYFPVAARIRDLLPKFRDLTDAQIMAGRFRLADAQELVARKAGFETWEALRQGVPKMPDRMTREATPAAMIAAEPQLFVSDIEDACRFYGQRLGFTTAFSYGAPPFYAQVVRDDVRLNLRHVDRPAIDPLRRDAEDLLAASITVTDAKSLFLEFRAAGVSFHKPLSAEPWGARSFVLRDPDGNLILFADGVG